MYLVCLQNNKKERKSTHGAGIWCDFLTKLLLFNYIIAAHAGARRDAGDAGITTITLCREDVIQEEVVWRWKRRRRWRRRQDKQQLRRGKD